MSNSSKSNQAEKENLSGDSKRQKDDDVQPAKKEVNIHGGGEPPQKKAKNINVGGGEPSKKIAAEKVANKAVNPEPMKIPSKVTGAAGEKEEIPKQDTIEVEKDANKAGNPKKIPKMVSLAVGEPEKTPIKVILLGGDEVEICENDTTGDDDASKSAEEKEVSFAFGEPEEIPNEEANEDEKPASA